MASLEQGMDHPRLVDSGLASSSLKTFVHHKRHLPLYLPLRVGIS